MAERIVPTRHTRTDLERAVPAPLERCRELSGRWGVTIDEPFETESSLVAYGRRGQEDVVLKVVKNAGDEWNSGDVLQAFGGRGVVRVLEQVEGAVMLERLRPGTPLSQLTLAGRDDDATSILADVIAAMSPGSPPSWCPTVDDWGCGFRRYVESGDTQVPAGLVTRAAAMYAKLCGSQQNTRLLHGDLQHYNILEDRERGWIAIDPKGVVGEVECELAAALRNPAEDLTLFARPEIVERRVSALSSKLGLDSTRVLRWTYALGVLSAVWLVEDGYQVNANNASLVLALAVAELGIG